MVFLNSEELDDLPHKIEKVKAGTHKLVVVDSKTRKRLKTTFTVEPEKKNTVTLKSSPDAVTLEVQREPMPN
jgi:hypothetical protein